MNIIKKIKKSKGMFQPYPQSYFSLWIRKHKWLTLFGILLYLILAYSTLYYLFLKDALRNAFLP